jgi:hypothetical protein
MIAYEAAVESYTMDKPNCKLKDLIPKTTDDIKH